MPEGRPQTVAELAGQASAADLARMEYEVSEALRVLGPVIVRKRS